MSAEQLAALAGLILSLLFSYVPGLSDWYEPLEQTKKRLIMLGLLVVVAAGVYGLSCGPTNLQFVTCDKAGVMALISAFITAMVANQATYELSPRKAAQS